jgi:hypothetical protein
VSTQCRSSQRIGRVHGLTLGVVLLALGVGLAAHAADARQGSARPLAATTNSANFTDPSGDGPLDVTSVSVTNDDQPNIHFEVGLATPIVAASDAIVIYVDTDANPNTGGASGGADYGIFADFNANKISLAKWDGSDFVNVSPPAPTLTASFSSTRLVVDVKQSDLGGSAAFNFWVGAFRGDTEDRAPDSSVWRYDVVIGPPPSQTPPEKLKAKGFFPSPNPPRAGESFQVEFDVVDAGTGKAVYAGVTCKGKLGGKAFRGNDFAQRGASFCVWDIPASAVGSILAGSITVFGDGGSSLTRSFRYTVVSPPIHLHFVGLATAPPRPRAGQTFYVAAGVEILEQGRPTRRIDPSAKGTCQASVGGQKVPAAQSQWQGRGWLCQWTVPPSTRGETFSGSIKVVWHGVSAVKSFRYSIL